MSGFPEAITAAFPKAKIQLCIVHMVRNSLRYVPSKDMKEVAKDLKSIYKSSSLMEAQKGLEEFSENGQTSTHILKIHGDESGIISLRFSTILMKSERFFMQQMQLNLSTVSFERASEVEKFSQTINRP